MNLDVKLDRAAAAIEVSQTATADLVWSGRVVGFMSLSLVVVVESLMGGAPLGGEEIGPSKLFFLLSLPLASAKCTRAGSGRRGRFHTTTQRREY